MGSNTIADIFFLKKHSAWTAYGTMQMIDKM